jgi:hypothetical protein
MFRLDWNNPKTSVAKIEELVSVNIPSIYDGIIVENGYLYVLTTTPMTSGEEDIVRNIVYSLNDTPQQVEVKIQPPANPFSAKNEVISGVLKKYYKREHGIQQDLTAGYNWIYFTIPYPWVKLAGIEILFGERFDYTDLYVLDSATGAYSTIPSYPLNKFGYAVNVAETEYEENSAYPADLYQGMQVAFYYYSQTAKRVAINFNLTEVKS